MLILELDRRTGPPLARPRLAVTSKEALCQWWYRGRSAGRMAGGRVPGGQHHRDCRFTPLTRHASGASDQCWISLPTATPAVRLLIRAATSVSHSQQFQFHVCVCRQTTATSNPSSLAILCRQLMCRSSASSRYTCSNFRTSIRLHKSCRLYRDAVVFHGRVPSQADEGFEGMMGSERRVGCAGFICSWKGKAPQRRVISSGGLFSHV
jgi:hypothetical protein